MKWNLLETNTKGNGMNIVIAQTYPKIINFVLNGNVMFFRMAPQLYPDFFKPNVLVTVKIQTENELKNN